MNNEHPRPGEPENQVPPEILHSLLKKWIDCFESAARADNREHIVRLFSSSAIICGIDKDGPFNRILSKTFKFCFDKTKISVFGNLVMAVMPWESPSPIVKGPKHTGWVTILAGIDRDPEDRPVFICYHAHFSLHE